VYTFTLLGQQSTRSVKAPRALFHLSFVDPASRDCDPPSARNRPRAPRIFNLLALAILACVPAALSASDAPATVTSPKPSSILSNSTAVFSWSVGTGASKYKLSLGTKGVGSSNVYDSEPTNARSVTVSGLPEDGLMIYVRLSSLIQGAWQNEDSTYIEAGTAVAPVMTSPVPGSPLSSSSATFAWSAGVGPSAYKLYLGTTGVDSSNLYNSGSITATSVTVDSLPENGATIYAALYWQMDTTWHHANYTLTAAPAAPALTGISCQNSAITGQGTDACVVQLTTVAGSSGFSVNLASSNSEVSIPSKVTVPAGSATGQFQATVSSVSTAQTVTLTASAGSTSKTFALQLNTSAPTLAVSATSLAFGNVSVGTSATQTLKLTSTGAAPVTVSSATVTGPGYSISSVTFPLTLTASNPTAQLTVQFDPTAAGSATGQLVLSSNSSTGALTQVSLSGTGAPVLAGISCTNSSMTGSGTDGCTVTLNTAAASGGFVVNLASSNSSDVSVPSSVTVPAGSTTAGFSAAVSAVSTAQPVTLTATAGTVTQTFALELNAYVATLSINATSVTFGDVDLNSTATQSVKLTSTGAAPVTVSSVTISGTGFTFSGASFPLTLNTTTPSATLSVNFDPTTAGAATGELTVSSDSSTGSTADVALTGTGISTTPYEVQVTWDAPSSSPDPVASYNIYRSPSGSSAYALMGSVSSSGELEYTDTNDIEDGQTYDYIVESVDASGNESVPSNMADVSIP
jgi:hypothetical protein